MGAFFKAHNYLVGLSLDGPREVHDAYRVDKGGQGTFDSVMRGWECSTGTRSTSTSSARCTPPTRIIRSRSTGSSGTRSRRVHPVHSDHRARDAGDAADRQPGLGRARQRPAPLYLLEGSEVTERSVAPEQWGRFLIGVFDEWIRRDVGTVFVQMFDAALASWAGVPPAMCVFNETCGSALALEHNGDVYSCDHFVEPKHLLGNIQKVHMLQLITSEEQRRFGLAKRDTLPRYCRDCSVRFACHGECPKNRFLTTPDGEPGLNYLCAGYKAFFTHIDRPMRRWPTSCGAAGMPTK